jgi:hypothetical protein
MAGHGYSEDQINSAIASGLTSNVSATYFLTVLATIKKDKEDEEERGTALARRSASVLFSFITLVSQTGARLLRGCSSLVHHQIV